MKDVGFLSKEDAISYGCTGPTGRASGFSCDIRKLYPYEVYSQVNFKEVVEVNDSRGGGDCLTRYQVRMEEMRQSISIIEQLIDNIPKEISRQKQRRY
jgi:NADH:ubiquinone oxidoreductase subunit D